MDASEEENISKHDAGSLNREIEWIETGFHLHLTAGEREKCFDIVRKKVKKRGKITEVCKYDVPGKKRHVLKEIFTEKLVAFKLGCAYCYDSKYKINLNIFRKLSTGHLKKLI